MTQDFIYWPVIDLVGIGIALFVAAALFFSPLGHRKANRLLALVFVFSALRFSEEYLQLTKLASQFPHLLFVDHALDFVNAPLIWMYLVCLTSNKDVKWTNIDSLRFAPFVIVILMLMPGFLLGGSEKANLGLYCINPNTDSYWSMQWIKAIQRPLLYAAAIHGGIYLFFSIRLLIRHQSKIKQDFSYKEHITLNWLYYLFLLNVVGWLAFMTSRFLLRGSEYDELSKQILECFTVISVFFGGIFALTQPRIYPESHHRNKPEEIDELIQNQEKYSHSALDDDTAEQLLKAIQLVVSEEKLYLDNTLSLNQLADAVNAPPRYVSQVINDCLGKNFFDFINSYRIEEAKIHLSNKANKRPVLDIAMEVGFNSKTAFYDAFKRNLKMTPSQFRKQSLTMG